MKVRKDVLGVVDCTKRGRGKMIGSQCGLSEWDGRKGRKASLQVDMVGLVVDGRRLDGR
jgi:hypothetical protein